MNDNFQSEQADQQKSNQEPSAFAKIVGQCLTFAPFIFEHWTGQKIPQMGGTMAEIQLVLSQILAVQQQINTNQQALHQRLVNLESNASHQLTHLANQVQSIKSIRLSHNKESKAIDYNLNQEPESY